MVTIAMRDGFAKAQRWEDETSGLSSGPYRSAFANLPWLLSDLSELRERVRSVPLPDSCTAASGALFDQLVGAAKQRQRGQFKLAHRSPRFEFVLVNLSQTVKCCLSDSDRGPLPSTKRVTDVTQ